MFSNRTRTWVVTGALVLGALLTGTAAAKARAAALAAVPGATVIRVETDSGDAAYEAHMQKADGSYVTVEMDSSFHVTGRESGFGGGPPPGTGSDMQQ